MDIIDYLFDIIGDGIFKEWIDLNKKETYGNVMVDDLGDTFPFAYYIYENYSEGINDNKKSQIDVYTQKLIRKYQCTNGLFITNRDLGKRNNKYINIYNADKMSDVALGLNLMFRLTQDEFYLDSAKLFFSGIESMKISNYTIPYIKFGFVKIPWFSGKWDGLYIEEKVNLYKLTKDSSYISSGMETALFWINTKFFQRNGLFSFESTPFYKPVLSPVFKFRLGIHFDSAMSSKANANLIFGLTELYLITKNNIIKEALIKWVEATKKLFMNDDGYFYSIWSEYDGQSYVFLGNDHAMVDALIEIYLVTGYENALVIAKKNMDYWLSRQTDNGYFPQGVEGHGVTFANWLKGKDPNMTRLDTLTDYGVMLLKIFELTNDIKYYDACKKMIMGLIEYSSYSGAYVDVIHTKTLEKNHFMIETKFLFLLTKLFISFDQIENKKSIYKDELFKNLIRDR